MPAALGNKYHATPQEKIDKIIKKILEWGHSSDQIYLSSFVYETWKRPKQWLYDLAQHHPDLKEAIKEAMQLNGGKIAYHCYLGDRNSAFGEKLLPIYMPEYKELLEWKASLAKQQLQNDEHKNALEQYTEKQKV